MAKYDKNEDTFHEPDDAADYFDTDDDVVGDPAPKVLGRFGGKINQLFQALFDNVNYLKKRIGQSIAKATQADARAGTDNEKYLTALRVLDALRNGVSFRATINLFGVVKRLTNAQARVGTDTEGYASIATILDALRNGSPFRANTSRYGTVQTASKSDVLNEQNTHRAVTVDALYSNVTYNLNSGNTRISNRHAVRQGGSDTYAITTIQSGTSKFFGPIFISGTGIRITITGSATRIIGGAFLDIEFPTIVNVNNFAWDCTATSTAPNANISCSVEIRNTRTIRVNINVQSVVRQDTIIVQSRPK